MEQTNVKLRAVAAMLNVFPQSVGDVDLGLKTYKAIIEPYPDELVVQACKRFLTGKVPGQNKAFAPSLPQFIEELDAMQERERIEVLRAELESRSTPSSPALLLSPNRFRARWERGEVPVAEEKYRDQIRKSMGTKDASNG